MRRVRHRLPYTRHAARRALAEVAIAGDLRAVGGASSVVADARMRCASGDALSRSRSGGVSSINSLRDCMAAYYCVAAEDGERRCLLIFFDGPGPGQQ